MKSSPNYRFIDHGGDVEIEVYGSGVSELFSSCIESTADIIVPVTGRECNSRIELEYSFSDYQNLLVQVLTDVIVEFEVNDTLYFKVENMDLDGTEASITLGGYKFSSPPEVMTVLKAATYHELEFDPEAGIARITFDL